MNGKAEHHMKSHKASRTLVCCGFDHLYSVDGSKLISCLHPAPSHSHEWRIALEERSEYEYVDFCSSETSGDKDIGLLEAMTPATKTTQRLQAGLHLCDSWWALTCCKTTSVIERKR